MRKLVITQNITLDGSVEMLDDWFDPQLQDEDLLEESHRQDSQADALLVGRQTFEDFRGYWPNQTDDPTGVTDYLNRVAKYVVSSTMSDPEWENSTVLTGDPVERVTRAEVAAGQGHRADRQHQPRARADRGRRGRRIPVVRLSDGAGPRPSTLSRRDRDSEADIGGTAEVVPVGYHAAALRRVNAADRAIAIGGTVRIAWWMTASIRRPRKWDTDRDETEAQRLDRNWSSLLQELRVAQTGVQLLTGFLLTLPFQQRFTQLDGVMRDGLSGHGRVFDRRHRVARRTGEHASPAVSPAPPQDLGVGRAQLRDGGNGAAGRRPRRGGRRHLRHRGRAGRKPGSQAVARWWRWPRSGT